MPEPRRRHKRGRRLLRILALLLVVIVVLGWGLTMTGGQEVGHFDDEEGKARYMAAYERAMEQLPEPDHVRDVETTYGTVRAYHFSGGHPEEKVPFVVAPGRAAPAPMWFHNIGDLVKQRPVWLIDNLGDAGRSVQEHPITSPVDEVSWLDQAVVALAPEGVHLVGHSFGGYLAASYATSYPDRLISLSLIDPVFTFNSVSPQMVLASIPTSLSFLPASWRQASQERIGGGPVDPNDPNAAVIDAAMEHFEAKMPTPDVIPEARMKRLTMPVLVLLAGDSFVHDASEAERRARELLPAADIELVPGASHSLPMENPGYVDRRITDFTAAAR